MKCYVLCNNDFPRSVYLSKARAESFKRVLEKREQQRRKKAERLTPFIYYHIQEVPLFGVKK